MTEIYPDDECLEKVERKHPELPRSEKWRLAQEAMLIKISGAESLDQLKEMQKSGKLDRLISKSNRKIKGAAGEN